MNGRRVLTVVLFLAAALVLVFAVTRGGEAPTYPSEGARTGYLPPPPHTTWRPALTEQVGAP